jgi:hypothetical protein
MIDLTIPEISKIRKINIWFLSFYKSFVWLVLPFCIWSSIKSCEGYLSANSKLTPYSVTVKGYYRSDGTRVESYKRRPPGSVAHDKPYERAKVWNVIQLLFSVVIGILSFIFFLLDARSRINSELNKIAEALKNQLERDLSILIDETVFKLRFDFSKITEQPENIFSGTLDSVKGHSGKGAYKCSCKYCGTYFQYLEFYTLYKAQMWIHFVCIDCLKKREKIGMSLRKADFIKEIEFVTNYEIQLLKFSKAFKRKITGQPLGKYLTPKIKAIFDSEYNRILSNRGES